MKTLSDTRFLNLTYHDWSYSEEDVKEFIRKLKEEIKNASCGDDYYNNCNFITFKDIIDKLAGEKLSKPTEEKE